MPTILIEDGCRVFFYSADWSEPPHVHVEVGDADAKFWLGPVRLASSYRMRSRDLRRARSLVEKHAALIMEKWNEYFGRRA